MACATLIPALRRDVTLAQQLRQLLPAFAQASKTAGAAPKWPQCRSHGRRGPHRLGTLPLLVPGSGPEQPGVALDLAGAQCCRAGQAPFIVVSGGMCTRFTRRFVRQLR